MTSPPVGFSNTCYCVVFRVRSSYSVHRACTRRAVPCSLCGKRGSNPRRPAWETPRRSYIKDQSMTGSLQDRPVGLLRAQFRHAQEHGMAYWLYVVEHAGTDDGARIIRIQDPAGRARTFTFDLGWIG